MSVIYLVLPLAVVLAALGVWAFIRAARQGQFDDLETPAARMLLDDDPPDRPARS
ncbi:MAG TPA: cbb3-type cytochrome oxidase assembly protein CcoS [Phycisphaerales bacterium]|nr:cbb3-type cytochrome oxidase assembly protein CcoS [Phycisphaerales bacterium]